MGKYSHKTVLILGMGKSGLSLAEFFHRRKAIVFGYDDKKTYQKLNYCPVISNIESLLTKKIDLLAISPGIMPSHPVILWAKENHIPIRGEIEIALEENKNRCIGITGTNGKSTHTALIAHVLNQSGYKAKSVGNIGVPLSSVVDHLLPDEILVLELSSYQLDSMKIKSLDYALLLNISEDHLDRYHTLDNYARSKCSIAKRVKEDGVFIVSKSVAKKWNKFLENTNPLLFDESSLFEGATTVLKLLNIEKKEIKKGYQAFKGLPHRCEFVCQIGHVHFINDSKATNVESVCYAVSSMKKPIHLIMGGDDKGLDYCALKSYFLGKVKAIYFIGQSKEKMAKVFANDYNTFLCESIEQATKEAYKNSDLHEIVLLSPGTSSFDMFDHFEHRGEEFKRIVKQLEGENK